MSVISKVNGISISNIAKVNGVAVGNIFKFLDSDVTISAPSGYTKYQEVTIDNTKVSETLTDFPVYIDLSDLSKAGADIFDIALSDGGDIRVTTESNAFLPREVISIDTTAKTGSMFVKYSGSLSSSVDTILRIWYNGTDAEPTSNSTYGSENVWANNYTGVWHMEEDPSVGSYPMLDSTSSGHDGDAIGTMTAGDSVAGKLSKCLILDGTDDHIFFKNGGGSHPVDPTNGTASFWVNPDIAAPSASEYIFRVQRDPNRIYLSRGVTSGNLLIRLGSSSEFDTGDNIPDSSWSLIHVTWNSGTYYAYLNGVQIDTGSYSGLSGNNSRPAIGAYNAASGDTASGSATGFFEGHVDEVRLSDVVRTVGYALTEFNNQNSPNTFYSTSNEIIFT
ncbi:MAG: hypothetical protein COA79_21025 [Planctomycetota bacterium]|nr:MAG: hypothetical protein COA79_21025 [Planctomycetota bacterium]